MAVAFVVAWPTPTGQGTCRHPTQGSGGSPRAPRRLPHVVPRGEPGELEQAIPVMQAFRAVHPETPWLLTVYSPSAWHLFSPKARPTSSMAGPTATCCSCPTLALHLAHLVLVAASSRPCLGECDLWPNLLAACQAHNPVHASPPRHPALPPIPSPRPPRSGNSLRRLASKTKPPKRPSPELPHGQRHRRRRPRVERVLSGPHPSIQPAAWA